MFCDPIFKTSNCVCWENHVTWSVRAVCFTEALDMLWKLIQAQNSQPVSSSSACSSGPLKPIITLDLNYLAVLNLPKLWDVQQSVLVGITGLKEFLQLITACWIDHLMKIDLSRETGSWARIILSSSSSEHMQYRPQHRLTYNSTSLSIKDPESFP